MPDRRSGDPWIGAQGKPVATYHQTRKVIAELYAEAPFEGNGNDYGGLAGQDNLKEDTKQRLARMGLTHDNDILRKALDAQEHVEKLGLRRR